MKPYKLFRKWPLSQKILPLLKASMKSFDRGVVRQIFKTEEILWMIFTFFFLHKQNQFEILQWILVQPWKRFETDSIHNIITNCIIFLPCLHILRTFQIFNIISSVPNKKILFFIHIYIFILCKTWNINIVAKLWRRAVCHSFHDLAINSFEKYINFKQRNKRARGKSFKKIFD